MHLLEAAQLKIRGHLFDVLVEIMKDSIHSHVTTKLGADTSGSGWGG